MKYLPPLAVSIMIVSLGACGQTPGRSAAENQAASTNTQAPAQLGPSERLLAAAEPFEKLTEIAFTAPLPEIEPSGAAGRDNALVYGEWLGLGDAGVAELVHKQVI